MILVIGFTAQADDDKSIGEISFLSNMSGNIQLYLIDTDGSNLRQLTSAKEEVEDYSWSPDGKSIVFNTRQFDTTGRHDLFLLDVDSDSVENLTDKMDQNSFNLPVWSPNCSFIAFLLANDPGTVGVIKTADKSITYFPNPLGIEAIFINNISWFPDGKEFLASTYLSATNNGEIYVADLDTLNFTPLYNNPKGYDVSVSPDGHQFAFFQFQPLTQETKLLITNEAGKTQELFASINHLFSPEWSQDSQNILIQSISQNSQSDIFSLNMQGDVQNLTNTPDLYEANAVWSADNKAIAFISLKGYSSENIQLQVRKLTDNTTTTVVHNNFWNGMPQWRPELSEMNSCP